MKVIFLDIDGVLNSHRTFMVWGCGFLRKTPPHTVEGTKLDPVAIALLKATVIATGAKIVISSTWRRGSTVEDFNDMFKAYGWDTTGIVIGMTPTTDKGFRGDEVDMWLADHPEVENFMIIDDDCDMTKEQLKNHFTHSDIRVGFDEPNVQQILKVFGTSMDHFLKANRPSLG